VCPGCKLFVSVVCLLLTVSLLSVILYRLLSSIYRFPERRSSPAYLKEVFFLGFASTVPAGSVTSSSAAVGVSSGHPATVPHSLYVELCGTSFALTKQHLVTAYHNLLQADEKTLVGDVFQICRSVKKVAEYNAFEDPIAVKIALVGVDEDWAILAIEDKTKSLNGYIPLCPLRDLPNPSLLEHEELKTYHAPIGQYLSNGFETGQIWCEDYKRVLQYDREGTIICVDGGLYRGSCGAPYVDHQGRVVAMHLSSMHEGKEYSHVKKKAKTMQALAAAVDAVVEHSTDLSDVHYSIRQGLVLARIPRVVQFVEKNASVENCVPIK
jgi:hypothetical protein